MLSTDLKKVLEHLLQDPPFRKVIASIELTDFNKKNDVYSDLIRSIISQQLSVKAAATIHGRFLKLFRSSYPKPNLLLKKTNEQLRTVGLSRQKSGYVKNVAQFAMKENLLDTDWSKYSDEEIINYLTQIKGVGKWTVQMILMFSLKRPDVFPVDDLGIQQGIIQLYNVKETGRSLKPKLIQISEKWSPYRSTACRYIWKWKDSQ